MFSWKSSRIAIENPGKSLLNLSDRTIQQSYLSAGCQRGNELLYLDYIKVYRLRYPLLFTRAIKLIAGLCAFVLMEENLNVAIPHLNEK